MLSTLVLAGGLLFTASPAGATDAVHAHETEHAVVPIARLVDAAMARTGQLAVAATADATAAAESRLANAWLADGSSLTLVALDDAPLDDLGQHEYSAAITVPLWHGGERTRQRELASTRQETAELLRQVLRWELAGQIIDRAAEVFLAERDLALMQSRLQSARLLEAAVTRFVAVGDAPAADAVVARMERVRAEAEQREARAVLESAQDRYRSLVGEQPLSIHLEAGFDDWTMTLPDWETHPQVALLDKQLAILAIESEQASLPTARRTISAGVRRERGEGIAPEIDALMVELSIPLRAHARTRRAVAAVEERITQLAADRAALVRSLGERFRQARRELEAISPVLEPLEEALEQSADLLKSLEQARNLGEISLEALLRARERHFELARHEAVLAHEREHLEATLAHIAARLP